MTGLVEALRANFAIARRSDWLVVDQPMIDRFAETTSDYQFIHVDPARAAATPFGGTVAHGLLTLSLLPRLLATVVETPIPLGKLVVNYGFDRVRFVHPVRCGSRIRAAFTLLDIQEKRPGQIQQSSSVVVEIDGVEKPALTAVWICQHIV
jgi:acyl dehydratase